MELVDLLYILSKTQLVDIRKKIGFKGMSSFNKDQLVRSLAHNIPRTVASAIYYMDEERYKLVQKLIKNNGTISYRPGMVNMRYFEELGLIFHIIHHGKDVLMMPTEIMEACKAAPQPDSKRNSEIYACMCGMLANYGVVSREDAHTMMEKVIRQEIKYSWFIHFSHVAGEYYDRFRLQGNYFIDNLVQNEYGLIEEHERRDDLGCNVFSKEFLMSYQSDEYFHMTAPLHRLEAFLHKSCDITEDKVEELLRELVYHIRLNAHSTQLMERFIAFVGVKDEEELNVLISLLVDVMNTTPLWVLKGHAPSDLSRKMQPMFNVVPFKKEKQVSRNSPCPCDSGKKYKKCCGQK